MPLPMWQNLLWVAVGGVLGVWLRYLCVAVVVNWVGAQASPGAILTINVFGCLIIGLVLGSPNVKPQLALMLTVGFCGGLTTFSTLVIDLITLYQTQDVWTAIRYLVLSILLGIGAAVAGLWIGKRL